MTLLLDTNILLWWLEDSPRLPKRLRQLIHRGGKVLVSAATVWEIAVKKAIGKLKAPNSLEEALAESSFSGAADYGPPCRVRGGAAPLS